MDSSAFVRQLVEKKENSEFQPVKLRLKFTLSYILPELKVWYIYIYPALPNSANVKLIITLLFSNKFHSN